MESMTKRTERLRKTHTHTKTTRIMVLYPKAKTIKYRWSIPGILYYFILDDLMCWVNVDGEREKA